MSPLQMYFPQLCLLQCPPFPDLPLPPAYQCTSNISSSDILHFTTCPYLQPTYVLPLSSSNVLHFATCPYLRPTNLFPFISLLQCPPFPHLLYLQPPYVLPFTSPPPMSSISPPAPTSVLPIYFLSLPSSNVLHFPFPYLQPTNILPFISPPPMSSISPPAPTSSQPMYFPSPPPMSSISPPAPTSSQPMYFPSPLLLQCPPFHHLPLPPANLRTSLHLSSSNVLHFATCPYLQPTYVLPFTSPPPMSSISPPAPTSVLPIYFSSPPSFNVLHFATCPYLRPTNLFLFTSLLQCPPFRHLPLPPSYQIISLHLPPPMSSISPPALPPATLCTSLHLSSSNGLHFATCPYLQPTYVLPLSSSNVLHFTTCSYLQPTYVLPFTSPPPMSSISPPAPTSSQPTYFPSPLLLQCPPFRHLPLPPANLCTSLHLSSSNVLHFATCPYLRPTNLFPFTFLLQCPPFPHLLYLQPTNILPFTSPPPMSSIPPPAPTSGLPIYFPSPLLLLCPPFLHIPVPPS
ncbi:extensin-like [Haliotis rufescens]|uniref:extensin-like n=1 Tax=Haliotis rufescens TaxID=6454 RepID=UPI00201F546E|nr:extensin-like [Haliotis rufescens]